MPIGNVYEFYELGDSSGTVIVTERVTGLNAYRLYHKEFNKSYRDELSLPGVYFRFHRSGTENKVYIGQANNVFRRMREHFNDPTICCPIIEMLFFVKSDFTNTDTLYLEYKLTDTAKLYNNITVMTKNTSMQSLSDSHQSILDGQLESIMHISVMLGYPMFNKALWDGPTTKYLKLKQSTGFIVPCDNNKFVVLAGSKISEDVKPYAITKNPAYINKRKQLIDSGVIVKFEKY